MPSICTRHRRQEPKASSWSVAHSFGIFMSASAAARMTEVPEGTELECIAGLRGHVDRIVEHHDATVAEHAAALREGLIVERRVEFRFGPVAAERPAYLYRADRPACTRTPAEFLQQRSQWHAK